MRRRSFLPLLPAAFAAGLETPLPDRPRVPGTLHVRARRRDKQRNPAESVLRWEVSQTAIILCDMWDTHTCQLAAQRVAVMAPRMNQVVTAARSHGVLMPVPIASCPRDPEESRTFPIDDSEGGCDDPVTLKWTGPWPWKRQHPAIDILGFDGISDNGQEIYNYCRHLGITHIALMGVHTNMCILNRSFGIRQMTRLGMEVVLVRDLTDAMYDPRARPWVSHARGTELVIEHIEANWCPSIRSEDLTRVAAGSAGPAATPKTTRL